MEATKDLVVFFIFEDEEGYFDKEIFENIIELKEVNNIVTEEKILVYTAADGASDVISLEDVESYRYVPHNSHLSNYVCLNGKADYEWDEEGNLFSENKYVSQK